MQTTRQIAELLIRAEKTGEACAPIRKMLTTQNIAEAYAVQDYVTQQKLALGQNIVGKKIGLTSKKVQTQLGVNAPDFGVLLNGMQVENGGQISFSALMQPKAEAEMAFVLKTDLRQEQHSLEDIVAAIDYVVPAIEIVGSRIANWDIQIVDTVADNASASHFVLGEKQVPLHAIDLENAKMQLTVNRAVVSEGEGKACLGNPLNAVQWLANQMQKLGNPLRAGEVVLSGALGPMINLTPGDDVWAKIDGLGEVSFSVSKS